MSLRERDPLLDNAKFIAMILVVVGHAWTDLRVVPYVDAVYSFVYLFHIPVFVLLAGHLSRNFRLDPRSIAGLGAALLIPYVLFETAYERLDAWVEGHPVHHNAIAPSWLMWFLVSLFVWRLTVPLWRRMGARIAIPVAIAVSLWGGLSSNDDYAWSKTVSLLPFFVIGMFVGRQHLDWLRTASIRRVVIGAAVGSTAVCLAWVSSFDLGLFRWKYSYAELGLGSVDGPAARLGAIAAALILASAFIAVIPGEPSWYTSWGANTMYAYLLHGVVLQLAVMAGLLATRWAESAEGVLLITVVSAAVGVLAMSPAIKTIFRPVVEPGPKPVGSIPVAGESINAKAVDFPASTRTTTFARH